MPEYLIQHHQATSDHFDLRLELEPGVYRSWAIPKGLGEHPGDVRLAVPTPDHDKFYMLEGTIEPGNYGAGVVQLFDSGQFQLKDPVEEGKINFLLDGSRYSGSLTLLKTGENWILLTHSLGINYDAPLSVLSGRTMQEIAMNLPFKPQLAKMVESLPEGPNWIYEEKYDGHRLICHRGPNPSYVTDYPGARPSDPTLVTKLTSRTGQDWSSRYPHIAAEIERLDIEGYLDGEIVVLNDDGVSSFHDLHEANRHRAVYMVFDRPGMQAPLLERKAELKRLLGDSKIVMYVEHTDTLVDPCSTPGVEGAVAKNVDCFYQPGVRSDCWRKMKCKLRQEFVVTGKTQGTGKRNGTFGALNLGYYDDEGKLHDAGNVGTGFTEEDLKRVAALGEGAVIEAEFLNWTAGGKVRQAVFMGVREDVDPLSVRREMPSLTHSDKLLFKAAGLTKEGLATYYEQVADRMLPEVKDRPLTLLRCPDGVEKECFYQRHANVEKAPPGLRIETVEGEQYFVLATKEGFRSLAQLNVAEIHPWNHKVGELPDRIVFDLDPHEDVPWDQTVQAAMDLRAKLVADGHEPVLRTTGKKGLHVVVQIAPEHAVEDVATYAKGVATELSEEHPERYTASPGMRGRRGRVYIDWLRNGQAATSIASWSTRAVSEATVATPIAWEELATIDPASLTVHTVPSRGFVWDLANKVASYLPLRLA